MSIFIMGGGGNGIDVSDATATADKVLSGEKFYSNENEGDSAIEGTMPNNGKVIKENLTCDSTFYIAEGYHDGSGYVKAESLANQTTVGADMYAITASTVLLDRQGYINGELVTGTMPYCGNVSATLNPGDSAKITEGYHGGSGIIKAKENTGTYVLESNGESVDMGISNLYRYIDASALQTQNINTSTIEISALYTSGNGLDLGADNDVRYIKTKDLVTKATYDSKQNNNTETYTPSSVNTKIDLGATNKYRYIELKGYYKQPVSQKNVNVDGTLKSLGADTNGENFSSNRNYYATISNMTSSSTYLVIIACKYATYETAIVDQYYSAGAVIDTWWWRNINGQTDYTSIYMVMVSGVSSFSAGFTSNHSGYNYMISMTASKIS